MGELKLKIILKGHKTNTVTISTPTTPKPTSTMQTRKRKRTETQSGLSKRSKEESVESERCMILPPHRVTRSMSSAAAEHSSSSASTSSSCTGSKAFSSNSDVDTASSHTSPPSSLVSAAGHTSSWLVSKGRQRLRKGERLDRDYTFNAASPTDQSATTHRKTSNEWPVLEVHQIAPKRNSIEEEIAAATGTPSTIISQSSTTKAGTPMPSRSAKAPPTVELTKQLRKAIPGGQIELARKALGHSSATRPKQSDELNAVLLAAYEHVRDFEDFVADREAVWMQETLDNDSEIERLRRVVVSNASYIRVLEEQNEELLELMEEGQKSLEEE